MNQRDSILAKLRQGQSAWTGREGCSLPASSDIFADFPAEKSNLAEIFQNKLHSLRGECYRAADRRSAAEQVLKLLADIQAEDTLFIECPLLQSLCKASAEFQAYRKLSKAQTTTKNDAFGKYCASVTPCDALSARTGSVLLRSTTTGGRRASVLPEFHIVIATQDQLQASLTDWLRAIGSDDDWSYGVVATGPSRTADIEKILVLGAHGPKRLAVVLVG